MLNIGRRISPRDKESKEEVELHTQQEAATVSVSKGDSR